MQKSPEKQSDDRWNMVLDSDLLYQKEGLETESSRERQHRLVHQRKIRKIQNDAMILFEVMMCLKSIIRNTPLTVHIFDYS